MTSDEFYRVAVEEKDMHKKCELLRKGAASAHIPSIITLTEIGLFKDTNEVTFAEGKNHLERLARMAENLNDADLAASVGDMYGFSYMVADRFNIFKRTWIYNGEKAIRYYDRALSIRPDRDIMTKKGEILYREVFHKDALKLWEMAASCDERPSKRLLDDLIHYYNDQPCKDWKDAEEQYKWTVMRAELYGERQSDIENIARIMVDAYLEKFGDNYIDEDQLKKVHQILTDLTENYDSAVGHYCYSKLYERAYGDYETAAEHKMNEIRIMEMNKVDEMFIQASRNEYEFLCQMSKRK